MVNVQRALEQIELCQIDRDCERYEGIRDLDGIVKFEHCFGPDDGNDLLDDDDDAWEPVPCTAAELAKIPF
jgi:hypothetical protein